MNYVKIQKMADAVDAQEAKISASPHAFCDDSDHLEDLRGQLGEALVIWGLRGVWKSNAVDLARSIPVPRTQYEYALARYETSPCPHMGGPRSACVECPPPRPEVST